MKNWKTLKKGVQGVRTWILQANPKKEEGRPKRKMHTPPKIERNSQKNQEKKENTRIKFKKKRIQKMVTVELEFYQDPSILRQYIKK